MAKKNPAQEPYFQLTITLLSEMRFRKILSKYGWEGYGIFVGLMHFLHKDNLHINDVDFLAEEFKTEPQKLKNILDNQELFEIIDGFYISDIVTQNLENQKKVKKTGKNGSEARWGEVREREIKNPDFIEKVLSIYNKQFEVNRKAGKETQLQIEDVTADNKLSLEDWQTIFKNAHRGWQLPDGSNKKPTLKTMIKEWEAFLNDDYYLAEDEKAEEQLEKEFDENIHQWLMGNEEYDNASVQQKIEAQKVFQKHRPDGKQAAIKAAILFLRRDE